MNTLTWAEQEIPAALCAKQNERGIILLSDDWQKLRFVLLKNCLTQECKQTVGALDGLFFAIDDALKKIPNP